MGAAPSQSWLDRLFNNPSSTQIGLEAGIGIPLLLAGSLASAMGSPLGAPATILGSGLTGLGTYGLNQRAANRQNQTIGKLVQGFQLPANQAGPPEPPQSLTAQLMQAGLDPASAISLTKMAEPAALRQQPLIVSNGQVVNPNTATATPIKGYVDKTKPKPLSIGTPLAAAGMELGFGDPSTWMNDPAKLKAAQAQYNANRLAGERPPTVNIGSLGFGTDTAGNVVGLTRNPKTGAIGSVPLPPGVKPLKGDDKGPSFATLRAGLPKYYKDNYSASPADVPGGILLHAAPGAANVPASGVGGSLFGTTFLGTHAPPILLYLNGKTYKPGDVIGTGPDGKPVRWVP